MYSPFRGMGVITIDLYRDGVEAPWGIRVKGGVDVDGGTPLEVTKVSPVYGRLIINCIIL